MKTKRIIIILVIVALIAGLIVSYNIFFNKTSKNDSSFVGNTGGNLNNSGLFCQHNDKVYFANPYDSGSLYSMTPDENNIKKVSQSYNLRNFTWPSPPTLRALPASAQRLPVD